MRYSRYLPVLLMMFCAFVVTPSVVCAAENDEVFLKAEELEDRFFELEGERDAVETIVDEQESTIGRIEELQEEVSGLYEERAGLSEEYEEADPAVDLGEYNALVEELNDTSVALGTAVDELKDLLEERDEEVSRVTAFIGDMLSFRDEFERWYVKLDQNALPEDKRAYYAELKGNIDEMAADITEYTVICTERDNAVFVQVLINDEFTTTMLVDTGASSTVISPAVADALGLDYEREEWQGKAELADGRTVDAYHVVLSSVKVGDAEAYDVSAAVMETASGAQAILGMSFLRNFYFSVDANNKQLLLRAFRPK